MALGKLLLKPLEGLRRTCTNHYSTGVAVEPMDNPWPICLQSNRSIAPEEVCYRKLIIERTFAVCEDTSWLIDNNHIIIDIEDREGFVAMVGHIR